MVYYPNNHSLSISRYYLSGLPSNQAVTNDTTSHNMNHTSGCYVLLKHHQFVAHLTIPNKHIYLRRQASRQGSQEPV